MNGLVRWAVALCVVAFLTWVGFGVLHAGGDVPAPRLAPETKLSLGHAEGRRIDGKPSWSLDYDTLVTSADTTIATLENVRHGTLYKRGRPFMQMKAQHVVINTLSNDFTVTGPLELTQSDGKHHRRLTSNTADYSGVMQTLTLTHQARLTGDEGNATFRNATVNFKSGDMSFGALIGLF